MATSLIASLNANLGKTPDQIAKALHPIKWIQGRNMTQEQYDSLRENGGRIRLTENFGGGDWWEGGLRDSSDYRIQNWNLRRINSMNDLGSYWFIRYEDYVHGEYPPESA